MSLFCIRFTRRYFTSPRRKQIRFRPAVKHQSTISMTHGDVTSSQGDPCFQNRGLLKLRIQTRDSLLYWFASRIPSFVPLDPFKRFPSFTLDGDTHSANFEFRLHDLYYVSSCWFAQRVLSGMLQKVIVHELVTGRPSGFSSKTTCDRQTSYALFLE